MGLAIAALVVGIVAFLLGLLPVAGIILGLAGLTLGIMALAKKQPKGLALTGTILAGLAVIASIATTVGLGAAVDSVAKSTEKVAVETKKPVAEEVKEVEPEPVEVVTPEPVAEPVEPALTIGQQNASKSANQYISMMGFSRTGLIKQLEFEGYPTEDATFAADAIGVDWNAEAAQSAKQYIDMMAFSRDGLIQQLEFEGYTPEEAAFGATAVGY